MKSIAIKTLLFFITAGISLYLATNLPGGKVFAGCQPACGGGSYECQGGAMCCTGGGCPSYCCDPCCTSGCPWYGPFCCGCGTCGWCTQGPPPPPPCTSTSPGAPTAVSPSGYRGTVVYPIVFTWNAPGWGENCGNGSHHYRLYINGAQVGGDITTNSFSWTPTQCINSYSWYVVADNGAKSSGNSNTLTFWYDQTEAGYANSAPHAQFTVAPLNIRYDMNNPTAKYTFTATSSDVNSNLSLMGLFRKQQPSGVWKDLATGNTNTAAYYTAVSGSTGSKSGDWTPTCADVGVWDVAVNAVDSCASEPRQCTGNPTCNPAADYGKCAFAGWYDCGPGDSKVVNILGVYTLVIKVVQMGDGNPASVCPSLNYATAPVVAGASVSVTDAASGLNFSGVTDAAGTVTIPNVHSEVTQVQMSVNVPNPPYCNGGYDFACEGGNAVAGNVVTVNVTPAASCGTSTKNVAVREKPASTWFTVVDGNIYGNSVTDTTCNQLAATYNPQLTGAYINQSNNTFPFGFYIHTDGDLTTSGAPVVEGSLGGFAKKLFFAGAGTLTAKDNWLAEYVYTVPTNGAVTTINNLNGYNFNYIQNSGNQGLYQVTADVFNAWASTAGTHTFTVNGPADNSGGLAILYVTGGAAKLTINGPIKSTVGAPFTWGRLLIVTDRDIDIGSFDGTVPVSSGHPAPGDATDLEVGILTTKNIKFLSKNDLENPRFTKDTPLLEIGPVISKQTIQFGRDLLLDNKYSPAHMIRYNSSFVYKLTKSERAHVGLVPYSGLFQMDTQWKYED